MVEVVGLSLRTLGELEKANWTTSEWQKVLAVYAEQGSLAADLDLPPMLGTYTVEEGVVRFAPRYAIEPGRNYRAVLRHDELPAVARTGGRISHASFQLEHKHHEPSTIVSQIYPTADILPENLLKFYVHFSAPMSRGNIYEYIHLLNESGNPVELPFLEIDEELWDPHLTRLTLFIDPGRIKRGVKPLEEVGPALEAGGRYSLVIDRNWRDGSGRPLVADFTKQFHVNEPDRSPPDPSAWRTTAPKAGSREPLTILFPEPMDHALAMRMIRVTDDRGRGLEGDTSLSKEEREWLFVPDRPWRSGPHSILVRTTIEDLAGNNIGKPFEVDLFEGVDRRLTNSTVTLPVSIE